MHEHVIHVISNQYQKISTITRSSFSLLILIRSCSKIILKEVAFENLERDKGQCISTTLFARKIAFWEKKVLVFMTITLFLLPLYANTIPSKLYFFFRTNLILKKKYLSFLITYPKFMKVGELSTTSDSPAKPSNVQGAYFRIFYTPLKS